jgi:hypothetical protein
MTTLQKLKESLSTNKYNKVQIVSELYANEYIYKENFESLYNELANLESFFYIQNEDSIIIYL